MRVTRGNLKLNRLGGVSAATACSVLGALVMSVGVVGEAAASCYTNGADNRVPTWNGKVQPYFSQGLYRLTLTPASVYVTDAADKAVGDVLVRALTTSPPEPTTAAGIPFGYCQNNTVEYFRPKVNAGAAVVGMANVYPTNVAGVGYRAIYPGGGSNPSYFAGSAQWTNPFGANGIVYYPGGDAVIEFVKTGEITGGTVTGNLVYAQTEISGGVSGANADLYYLTYILGAGIQFAIPTCNFAQAAYQIPLTKINSDFLTGVGSEAGVQAMQVKVSCSSPTMPNPPLVKFTATSGSVAGQDGTLQAAAGPNAAQGVGLKVRRQVAGGTTFTPIDFGSTYVGMGTNRTIAGNYSNWDLNFQVSYIQIDTNVVPGDVVGQVTIDVKYN